MGAEENGLSLRALAQRLEALERENERMRSENAELRHKVSTLEGSGTRRDEVAELRSSDARRNEEYVSEFEGLVSRRSVLSKAGAAAVAAVAAGTLLNMCEAKAHDVGGPISADNIRTHWISAQPHAGSGRIAVWGSGAYGGRSTWTRRVRCSCARPAAPRPPGGRSRRPLSEDRTRYPGFEGAERLLCAPPYLRAGAKEKVSAT